jgi:hypothetical protein
MIADPFVARAFCRADREDGTAAGAPPLSRSKAAQEARKEAANA